MKLFFMSLILFIYVTSCKSVAKHNREINKLHSVKDLKLDIDKLYNQCKRHHPKLYQYIAKQDLDFKFDSLKQTITQPVNSRTFYKKVAPVVSKIKQGHISVINPGKRFKKKEIKRLKNTHFEFHDLDLEYLEGKLLVANTHGKDTTLFGTEILDIEGEPISKLIETYKKRFASDGYNTTLHNRFVGKYFSKLLYQDKGFIDRLQVTFKSKDSIFNRALKRISKNDKTKKGTDSTVIKKGTKSRFKKKQHKTYGFIAKRNQYTRNFSFIGKDSTIAYMKLRSFTNGPYKAFYKASFSKINAAKTKHFILDLRDNMGGRIAEVDFLFAFLSKAPYAFVTKGEVKSRIPLLKSFYSNTTPVIFKVAGALASPFVIGYNWLKTAKKEDKIYYNFNKHTKYKAPHPKHYLGKLYVIINGNSFSAASLLSTHLKATQRAIFVGEETGGAYNGTVAGFYKNYTLPKSKLKIRMGLMQIEAPYKQNPCGYGIKPDFEINPTLMDRKLNIDTELQWLLKRIYKP